MHSRSLTSPSQPRRTEFPFGGPNTPTSVFLEAQAKPSVLPSEDGSREGCRWRGMRGALCPRCQKASKQPKPGGCPGLSEPCLLSPDQEEEGTGLCSAPFPPCCHSGAPGPTAETLSTGGPRAIQAGVCLPARRPAQPRGQGGVAVLGWAPKCILSPPPAQSPVKWVSTRRMSVSLLWKWELKGTRSFARPQNGRRPQNGS